MRLSAGTLLAFFFLLGSSSQYFCAAWTPGQKVTTGTPAKPHAPASSTGQPGAAPDSPPETAAAHPSSSFIEKLLTSGPVVAFFNSFGVNITERVNVKLWDERIQLITDENYQDVVVNERLTPQQEKDRVWVILITGQAVKQDEISKLLDNVFDSAYDTTVKAGDLPHVKWGRIDYLSVTRLTTKWAVWQAPYLVILSDRGKTLRFYRHYEVRFREDNLREFLRKKEYLITPSWSSEFSPGGEWEYTLDYLATIIAGVYNLSVRFPRWLLVAISGGIGSLLIGFLHRPSKKTTKPETQPNKEKSAVTEAAPSANATPAKTEGSKPAPVIATPPTDSKPPPAKTADSKPPTTSITEIPNFKPASKNPTTASTTTASKSRRSASPSRPAGKTLTPAATDSERESSAGAPPVKRSARQRKTKRTVT